MDHLDAISNGAGGSIWYCAGCYGGHEHEGWRMTTYYLQCRADERWFIHSEIVSDAWRVMDSRQAKCWLDAKQRFGYGLSIIQERLLPDWLNGKLPSKKPE